jgi:hypothetical protein
MEAVVAGILLLPDDLLILLFTSSGLIGENSVSFAISSKRLYSAFLTARNKSFNFRRQSYIYADQVYRERFVEYYFFRFDWIYENKPYESDTINGIVHFLGEYESLGCRDDYHTYKSIDPKHQIPGIGCSAELSSLIVSVSQKIKTFDIVNQLFNKTKASFTGWSLKHAWTNVFMSIDYSASKSDHRPFYQLNFTFEFMCESDTYNGEKRKSPQYLQNSIKGHFRDPYHTTDNIAACITTLANMESYVAKAVTLSSLEPGTSKSMAFL